MPRSVNAIRRPATLLLAGAMVFALAGCGTTIHSGYIASDVALQQVSVGSSRDQVLIALGTPSTTGEFGGEVFYYISQTRKQAALFLQSHIVDQKVLAVYFDSSHRVSHIADYGLQDGQVFDFVTNTTPTGGEDITFVQQILRGVSGIGGR